MNITLIAGLAAASAISLGAAQFVPNYDESKVPQYTLPDPLVRANGKAVEDVKTWENKRRPELLKLFEEEMFGRSPGKPPLMKFSTWSQNRKVFDGKATRKEITIYFTGKTNGPSLDLLIYGNYP